MTFIPATLGLEAFMLDVRIGVGDEERSKPQPLRITIACSVDIGAAANSDDIRKTVNYSLIRREILDRVDSASYRLLERFAGEVLEICFRHAGVRRCRVKVEKLTIFADSVPFIETDWIDRAVYANMSAEAAE